MRTIYILIIILIAIVLKSCVKPKDVPDTTTIIKGYVLDSITREKVPNINIAIFLSPLYQTQHWSSIDTIIKSDSTGHFYIQMNCDKYKEWAYMIGIWLSRKYGCPLKKIKVGESNDINIAGIRSNSYCVIDGKIIDTNNNYFLNNLLVNLYVINKSDGDIFVELSDTTDINGKFHIEFDWSDTLQENYKINVPKSELYYESDDYYVQRGVDSYYEIKLKPLK
jgi:hypothetical protein